MRSPRWRTVAADLYAEHEVTLVEAAKAVEVLDFAALTRRWATLADDVQARDDANFAFERRGFTLSPTIGGSAVSGFLDPEASAAVASTLAELQPPEGAGDTRSLAQRNADALVLLAQRSRGGTLPESTPIAGVELVISHDVLAGHPIANLDTLRCDIEGFGPIARITAERIVCDCGIAARRAQREVRDPRPWSAHPHDSAPLASRDPVARPALPVSGLPGTGGVVRRPPSRPLVARWCNEPRELRVAVPSTSCGLPRGWMEARPRPRRRPDARGLSTGRIRRRQQPIAGWRWPGPRARRGASPRGR